jgi:hypothetical protein
MRFSGPLLAVLAFAGVASGQAPSAAPVGAGLAPAALLLGAAIASTTVSIREMSVYSFDTGKSNAWPPRFSLAREEVRLNL